MKFLAKHSNLWILIALVGFSIFARLTPHPANFTPLAALALFGGYILPGRWAVAAPVAAMIISDVFIGLHSLILFTWGSLAVIAWLASRRLNTASIENLGLFSLGSSMIFFVITNFGVWMEGKLYARTLEGLISCYYNALPFLRGTVVGDLVYTAIIFSAYAFAVKATGLVNSRNPSPAIAVSSRSNQ